MKVRTIFAGVILLVFMGCSSSIRITHSWKSNVLPTKTYNKIMVVGMLPENERGLRESMENHFVDDLQKRGYNAVSSLSELGPKSLQNMEEQEILDKIKDNGFDAVITIVLLDKERERYYVPARITYSPYIIYQRHFRGYYSTIYGRIYTPGYYTINTKYFWESNFYNMESKELLYSVQTESFDPDSAASLSQEYGQMIVNDMAKEGILK
jgi:hypothetical protein